MFNITDTKNLPLSKLLSELHQTCDAITMGEDDSIANMANISAIIWQMLPDLNWAGFYRMVGDELVLGPFQGKAACIRIPLHKGVCGKAARDMQTQIVDDVHAFDGHIACDADSRSELVVPIIKNGKIVGVLDLDSPLPSRFNAEIADAMEKLITHISDRL
ncbi:hypothetical protein LPB140_10925 [Sphingorhabdus lutea]|uniref:GAF domain-containing protein n=1 Tax=Sphingorhabdus lutea TaxID=1913578 RepID=A0A1L3JDJ4_9SPHN|nr:GAF domain-containing protein [Sphingorhabdus lutea]APG63211.1 hypothetical protein LPB140_10925 [Sphingorhabdus lutea]